MPLQLLILSAPTGGTILLDATPFVTACTMSRNEHGPQELQATVRRSLYDAFRLYDAPGTLDISLNDGAMILWSGRLEEPGLSAGNADAIDLHAYGYWRALSDIPYTAFWSSTNIAAWRPVVQSEFFNAVPERFHFGTQTRLSISPEKGSTQSNAVAGRMGFELPSGSSRDSIGVQYSYELLAPVAWQAGFERFDGSWGFLSAPWTLNATGVVQTGAVHMTFTATQKLGFYLYLNAAAAVFGGETDSAYLRITNLRVVSSTTNRVNTTLTANRNAGTNVTAAVGSTTGMYVGQSIMMGAAAGISEAVTVLSIGSSTQFNATFVQNYGAGASVQGHQVYTDEIIKDLISVTNAANSTQLSSSTTGVASPGEDITDAVYLDTYPTDIATDLANQGDASGRTWEIGVDTARRLYFRVRSSRAQTWYVDISDISVSRSLDGLRNSAYAKYTDANNATVRSTASSNAASVQRYGVTRRQAVDAKTTNATIAGLTRDVALAASAQVQPRATFTLRAVYAASGARYPIGYVQEGDYLTIRNLPPAASATVDTIRTFRITRVEFNVMTNVLQVEPEAPNPTLDALISGRV